MRGRSSSRVLVHNESTTHAEPSAVGRSASACSARGSWTQPGRHMTSSVQTYGIPPRSATRAARVDLPDPVTP